MLLKDFLAMPIHPSADKFPYSSEDRIKTLAQDIYRNTLLDPIVTLNGTVLDGRNRRRAFEYMLTQENSLLSDDMEIPSWEYQGSDPDSFVISKNAQRRQLSTGQRVLTALHFLDYYKARAEARRVSLRRPNSDDETMEGKDAAVEAGEEFGFGKQSWFDGKKLHDLNATGQYTDLYGMVWGNDDGKGNSYSLNSAVTEIKSRETNRTRDIAPFDSEKFLSSFGNHISNIIEDLTGLQDHWKAFNQEQKTGIRHNFRVQYGSIGRFLEMTDEQILDAQENRTHWGNIEQRNRTCSN